MRKTKSTKQALLMSMMALLLCVSMLTGSTFAWFTDEVTTMNNVITAGNLDIQVTNGEGNDIQGEAKMFQDVKNWEPGVVSYENLTIKNVGSLALQYDLQLNFEDVNKVVDNQLGLSDALKIAVYAKHINPQDRSEATAYINDFVYIKNFKLDENLVKTKLLPGEEVKLGVVIWWQPGTAEHDNQWNVNNGRQTTDGKPLAINLGFNVFATQVPQEEDSFDKFYDDLDNTTLKATVTPLGYQVIPATWGMGGSEVVGLPLDCSYQFLPTQTPEQAEASGYGLWHADFVVTVDQPITEGKAAVAGYYSAFCDDFNNGNWVALSADLPAGTEVRLVDAMGQGNITVNYRELCYYSFLEENTEDGFLCGAWVDESLIGMTLTVELRLYEVPAKGECANGGGCNHAHTVCETGNYITVATYSHTFANSHPISKAVSTAAELNAAIANGSSNIALAKDLEFTGENMITVPTGANVTVNLNGHDIKADFSAKVDGASAIFTIDKNASLTINGEGDVHAIAAPTNTFVSSIFTNLGSLTINGGNYSMTYGTYAEGYLIPTIVDTNSNIGKATTTINGGTFTHTRNMFRNFAQPQRGANNATLIINGGNFSGKADDFAAIWNQKTSSSGVEGDGIVIVNGGNFTYVEVDNEFDTGVTIADGVNLQIAP